MAEQMRSDYQLIVIGGGPAGLAAAIAASRAGLTRVLLVERQSQLGGILNQCLHTGFGPAGATGPEYAASLIRQLPQTTVEIALDTTVLTVNPDRTLVTASPAEGVCLRRAQAVILASGCRERPIGSLPVTGTRPAGVFTAGTAQRMVNLDKLDIGDRFVVLGSGDVGLIMARRFKLLGKEVAAVVEKADRCGGLLRNKINCLDTYGIKLLLQHTVSRVHGSGRVSGVTINSALGGSEEFIPCDTLIIAAGLVPEQDLYQSFAAGQDWLFLCGNARRVHALIESAVEEARQAGTAAAAHIRHGCSGSLVWPGQEENFPDMF